MGDSEQQLKYQRLLADIALELARLKDFDEQINAVLKAIGECAAVSRAYIFFDNTDGTTSNTHEWCAQGITPQLASLQNVDYSTFPSWKKLLAENGLIASCDISLLPEDLRVMLEPQDIRAIVAYPLAVQDAARGFIGFDQCGAARQWSDAELELLRTVSGIISAACERRFLSLRNSQQEGNFREFFNAVDDIVLIGDSEGNLLYANHAATRRLGYSLAQLQHMNVLELHPAESRGAARKLMTEVAAERHSRFPLSLQTADGTILNLETRTWFGHWNGRPCLFAISKDISREQAKLERFTKLFDSNPALMTLTSLPDRKMTRINDTFIAKLGYSREEVIGKSALEINLLPDEHQQQELVERLTRDRKISNMELNVRRKDGSLLYGLISGEVLEMQGERTLLSVLVDITPQIELQHELDRQRGRLANIIDGTRLGTWEWNVKTGGTTLNARWAEIVGYTLWELEPISVDTWRNLTHPSDLRKTDEALKRHFLGETEVYDNEFRMRHKNGRWVWVWARGSVVSRTESGEPLIMFGTHLDITSRKHLEQQLKTAKKQAERANRAKSDFLARMSHDLRTPLTAVTGLTELMRDTPLNAEQTAHVRNLGHAANNLLSVITDILDFSKIEAGRMTLEAVPFSLRELLTETHSLLSVKATQKKLRLLLDEDPALPEFVCGDPGKLRQILVNLVGNALKFTDKGYVRIKTETVSKPDSAIVTFTVEDTGIGIPAERQPLLFKAFSQTDPSMSRKYGGTGLGLSIVLRLVNLMGGTVRLESEEGKGSKFITEIPFVLPRKDMTPVSLKNEHESSRALNLLVVDDSPDIVALAVAFLSKGGHIISTASDGTEAVALCRDNRYDAVFMDLQMPRMDGYEAVKAIRLNEQAAGLPRTPVFAFTAFALADMKENVSSREFDGYITKPFSRAQLLEVLAALPERN